MGDLLSEMTWLNSTASLDKADLWREAGMLVKETEVIRHASRELTTFRAKRIGAHIDKTHGVTMARRGEHRRGEALYLS